MHALPWTFLNDSSITVQGLVVHGSPWTPRYGFWAFMADEHQLQQHWELIPDHTDILLTHGPPRGILDQTEHGIHAGSHTLRQRIHHLHQLKLAAFGHIHEARGTSPLPNRATAVNASLVNSACQPVHQPITINL
jgi:Icc-related predicted phosphoesterase